MRRVLLIVLKLAVSGFLVAFFLDRVGWKALEEAFRSVNLSLWALAVALFVASNLLGAFQWNELLRIQSMNR